MSLPQGHAPCSLNCVLTCPEKNLPCWFHTPVSGDKFLFATRYGKVPLDSGASPTLGKHAGTLGIGLQLLKTKESVYLFGFLVLLWVLRDGTVLYWVFYFLVSSIVWMAFRVSRCGVMDEIIRLVKNCGKKSIMSLNINVCILSSLIHFSLCFSPFIRFPFNIYTFSRNVLGPRLCVRSTKMIMDPPCPQGVHVLVSLLVLHFHLQFLVCTYHHKVWDMNIYLGKGFRRIQLFSPKGYYLEEIKLEL